MGEWARADWLSLGQLVFTVFGFGLAIVQLTRSANANIASRDLLKGVRLQLLGNDLLLLLPQLHSLEDELDEALKNDASADCEVALIKYARSASEVAEMLELQPGVENATTITALRQAASSASKAKAELVGGSQRPLGDVVKLARSKITKVSPEVSSLIARLRRKVTEE